MTAMQAEVPAAPLGRDDIVTIRDLSVALPGSGDRTYAVHDLSLTLKSRQIHCIIGESGSGKSVTASAIMGLLPEPLRIVGGSIRLERREILGLSTNEMRALRGERMAMVFQEPMTALNPLMPIHEQIAEVITMHRPRITRADLNRRVRALIEDVHLPNPDQIMHAYPFQLSGGQRQRVMIAMALALEPALIIADEPTTALDVTTQAQILKLLRELQSEHHSAILFITHDFGVVREIADTVSVMRNGEVVEQGVASEVLNNPRHEYTRMLIDAVPSDRIVPKPPVRHAPLLKVSNLELTFGSAGWFGRGRVVKALSGVNLELQQGETLGIVGESGSGKTTLGRCVVRFQKPSAGTIVFQGQEVSELGGKALTAYRSKVQMIFQDPYRSLNPRRKISASLIEGPRQLGLRRSEALQKARDMLERVGLGPEALARYPHQFSGGQRQRISIARALMMEPRLIVADEAVSALDVSVQAQVLDLLETLRTDLGFAILFVTHDLRVAARLCDRILVMQAGECVEEGTPAQVFQTPRAEYTRHLISSLPGQAMREDLA